MDEEVEKLKQSNIADKKMFKDKQETEEFPMLTSTEKEIKRLKVILNLVFILLNRKK